RPKTYSLVHRAGVHRNAHTFASGKMVSRQTGGSASRGNSFRTAPRALSDVEDQFLSARIIDADVFEVLLPRVDDELLHVLSDPEIRGHGATLAIFSVPVPVRSRVGNHRGRTRRRQNWTQT